MKVLLTGVAGFIGHSVCLSLLARGDKVVGVDNLNDYYDVSLKQARLESIYAHPNAKNFTFVKLDLAEQNPTARLFEAEKPDSVIHLAAQAGVRYSLENPHAYINSNIVAFTNVLEACRAIQPRHLVFASSSSVYGGNTKLPFSESDNVDHPVSLYAATKKANELMAHTYSHLFGIPATGLRFFTVYGPWGRPDMSPFLFADAILNDKPIKVFNYGKMQRDFTYIDDIVQGVVAALMAPGLDRYEIINLGNHRAEELLKVISILESELKVKAIQDLLPIQPGDVPATYADIDLARAKLGFQPLTPIEVGIPRFVQWYFDYHRRPHC